MRSFMLLSVFTLAACQATPKTETIESQSPAADPRAKSPRLLQRRCPPRTRQPSAPWTPNGPGPPLPATGRLSPPCIRRTRSCFPRATIVKGEAVGKYNDAMTGDFSGPTELTTTAVEGRGDLAYAVGIYRATLTPKKPGAKPLPTEVGKYLEVLKKQSDGSWKIVYDMWSPDAPLKQ